MSKGTVLVVASSADKFELQAGKVIPTGFYAGHALEAAGGELASNDRLFEANVVQDRELITGQNPPSDHGIADLFVRRC